MLLDTNSVQLKLWEPLKLLRCFSSSFSTESWVVPGPNGSIYRFLLYVDPKLIKIQKIVFRCPLYKHTYY